ncbi:MAG: sigma-70 family RNA polymerase sigma factor [Bacteroidales bacterium]
MDDKYLLDLIRKGDKNAFKELVLKYQSLVINTCHSFLRNRKDAEDVAQEVFIEVFKSISNFRQESKLSTWLYRISVNKSLNYLRDNKKNSWFQSLDLLFEVEKNLPNNFSDTENPGDIVEKDECSDAIYKAINSLPDNQKTSFNLHKLENLSYKEIAEIMDVSLSSVESLIFRAKKNLQKKLILYYKKSIN